MLIRYTPDDGDPQEFVFRPGELESEESEAVEEVGGSQWGTYEEWGAVFFRGSARARRALLWVMLRRANPTLRFQDVSFRTQQVVVDYTYEERQRIMDVMLADPNLDDEQRTHLKSIIDGGLLSETTAALEDAGVPADRDFPKDQPPLFGSDDSTSPPPD